MQSETTPMSKEWCLNLAKQEAGHEVGAGIVARDPALSGYYWDEDGYCDTCGAPAVWPPAGGSRGFSRMPTRDRRGARYDPGGSRRCEAIKQQRPN